MKRTPLMLLLPFLALSLFSCGGNPTPSSQSSLTSESSISSDSSTTESKTSDTSSTSESPSSESKTSESSSSIPYSGDEEDFWAMNLNLYGKDFMVSLAGKINATRTKTASYSDCLRLGAKAAAFPEENSSTFIPFYHAPKESETTTQSQCNREHTWPNSRGSKKTGMGADPVMIRPTLTSDNSSRGNNFYGLGGTAAKEWDPASCGYEAARGESARIILYCATAYYSQGFSLSNNPNDPTTDKTMGTLKTLLAWNRDYPPSDFEKTVNDRYDKMGYARNAFVDHPEFADYIYDDSGVRKTPLAA